MAVLLKQGHSQSAVAAHAAAIAHWREQQTDGRINLAALHDWLRREHGYAGAPSAVDIDDDPIEVRDTADN